MGDVFVDCGDRMASTIGLCYPTTFNLNLAWVMWWASSLYVGTVCAGYWAGGWGQWGWGWQAERAASGLQAWYRMCVGIQFVCGHGVRWLLGWGLGALGHCFWPTP